MARGMHPRRPATLPRMPGLALAATLILAGCGGAQTDPSGPSPSAGAPTSSPAPTATPAAASPAATFAPPLAEPDPAVLAALLAEGAGEADAAILAMTGIAVEAPDPLHYRLLLSFVTGELLELLISVDAADGATEPAAFSSATAPDGGVFSLRYPLDATGAPPELTDALAAQALGRLLAGAPEGAGPIAAGDKSTLRILVEGTFKQGAKELVSATGKWLDKRFLEKTPVGANAIWKSIKQGGYVYDAAMTAADVEQALDTLDALRDCVAAPSDPKVRQQYSDFPEDQTRLLDQIDDAKSDVSWMGLWKQVAPATKSAASVASLPALSFIISPGFSAANDQLSQLMANRVAEIAKQVTPCGRRGGWTIDYRSGSIRVTGQKCGGLGGTWKSRHVQETGDGRLVYDFTFQVSEATLDGTWSMALRFTSPNLISTANPSGRITDVELRPDGQVVFQVEWPPTIRQTTVVLDPKATFVNDLPMPDGVFPFNWKPTATGCD